MRFLLIFFIIPAALFCQNTIGLPEVINYSKQSYNGGLQNWDIAQDKNGIIYIANNEGLLSFDGFFWNLYPLPNKTIARSVRISNDNRIYVGAQDEFGYFFPDANGRIQYHSLTQLIPINDRSFGDVWDIVEFNKEIFFRTPAKIFRYTGNSIAIYEANLEWSYLGVSNGILFAHDFESGLLTFSNNYWKPLVSKNILPPDDPVTSIIPRPGDQSLITTLKSGLFIYSMNSLKKIISPNSRLFEAERIYAACLINQEWVAVATNNSGLFIIDLNGNIIQSFSKSEGLQNNNILSVFLDKQSNLWLGLDNGIDFIAYNSAIKQIIPKNQDGSGYTAVIYQNELFLGTSNGLFSVGLQQTSDLSFSKGTFNEVADSRGQTWSLKEVNGKLLLGSHEGAYIVQNNKANKIIAGTGHWNYIPVSAVYPTQTIISGNYKGLSILNYSNNNFRLVGEIPGFEESSRFVTIDTYGSIWVSHPYHGVYKIDSSMGSWKVNLFSMKNGLPSDLNNHVYKIKNEILIATINGVYIFNRQKNRFEPSAYYQKIFGNLSLRYLAEDPFGNIWFIHDKILGVADFTGKTPQIIYLPELTNKMVSGFEFIYPVDENNIFLGGEKGFYHINYSKYKKILPDLNVRIRTVEINNKKDSILFGGYILPDKEMPDSDNETEIDPRWKTIRLEYSSSLFGYQSNLEFSYKLEGFDENWSDWNKRTEKEYTNLKAGKYTFLVKVRNNLGNESQPASYTFKILPAWHQTILAKTVFLLAIACLVYLLIRWQKKKFQLQQIKHKEEQKRLQYIHELERSKAQSELMALRNEKLESEINFKNSEMASSAMHLVKKGELLSKIKNALLQLIKTIDNPEAKSEIRKMVKSLNDDENIDQEWDNFSKHFDKVHSDFLLAVKKKHPDITPNEHKLCAYLRMNLTTKEIAQLMNISVRGVEISRYRLRKKLGISTETNLFDYLIKLLEETPSLN